MREPVKKITVNVPEKLLKNIRESIGLSTTEAVIEGLREIEKREKRNALRRLKGKIKLDLDLTKTRK